jgi:hypothetical protein
MHAIPAIPFHKTSGVATDRIISIIPSTLTYVTLSSPSSAVCTHIKTHIFQIAYARLLKNLQFSLSKVLDGLRYISYTNIKKYDLKFFMSLLQTHERTKMFQLEFYETADAKKPISDLLDSLDDKMAAKLLGLMEILEEKGTELRLPYSDHLEDGIFELRCKLGSNITRALYRFENTNT